MESFDFLQDPHRKLLSTEQFTEGTHKTLKPSLLALTVSCLPCSSISLNLFPGEKPRQKLAVFCSLEEVTLFLQKGPRMPNI
jgi:hypothetical protein